MNYYGIILLVSAGNNHNYNGNHNHNTNINTNNNINHNINDNINDNDNDNHNDNHNNNNNNKQTTNMKTKMKIENREQLIIRFFGFPTFFLHGSVGRVTLIQTWFPPSKNCFSVLHSSLQRNATQFPSESKLRSARDMGNYYYSQTSKFQAPLYKSFLMRTPCV